MLNYNRLWHSVYLKWGRQGPISLVQLKVFWKNPGCTKDTQIAPASNWALNVDARAAAGIHMYWVCDEARGRLTASGLPILKFQKASKSMNAWAKWEVATNDKRPQQMNVLAVAILLLRHFLPVSTEPGLSFSCIACLCIHTICGAYIHRRQIIGA